MKSRGSFLSFFVLQVVIFMILGGAAGPLEKKELPPEKESSEKENPAIPEGFLPGAHLQQQYEKFQGNRGPHSSSHLELRVERLSSTRQFRILEVNPLGPYRHFSPGQIVDENELQKIKLLDDLSHDSSVEIRDTK